MWTKVVGTMAIAVLASSWARDARATPSVGCGVSVPAESYIGESTTAVVTTTNTGTGSGFVPAADVFVPAGLTISGATSLGVTLTVTTVGTCATGTMTNPLTGVSVTCPVGDTYAFIRYPLSSLTASTGGVPMDVTLALSTSAAVGTALGVEAICEFSFGTDVLNNPSTDPPLDSTAQTAEVNPTAVSLSMTGGVTVTGPDFPVDYALEIKVAGGATLAGGATITDTLDNRFQVTSYTLPPGATISPASPPSTPGGTFTITLPSIAGSTAAVTKSILLNGYIPEYSGTGKSVLDPVCGADVEIPNNATLSGASYKPSGGSSVSLASVSASANMEAHSAILNSTITTAAPYRSGDIIGLQLVTEISDYFSMSDDPITVTLPAGLTYASGTASLTPVTVSGHAPTTLEFDPGALAGGLPGGTTYTITYQATVDQYYSGANAVNGTDVISTSNSLAAAIAPGGCAVSSTPITPLTLGQSTYSKSIYQVNGATPASGQVLNAGDVVTWRLLMTQYAGSLSSTVLTDSLPMPVFLAEEHGTSPTFGTTNFQYGPTNTVPAGTNVSVTVSPSNQNNTVSFTLGAFETDPATTVTIDILFNYTVTDQPASDLVTFVNVAQGEQDGTGVFTTAGTLLASLELHEPDLKLTLGVVSTDDSAAVATPAFVDGPYDSTLIDATPVTSSVTNLQAADTLQFALIVENQGSGSAYNVDVSATLPTGLSAPAGGWVSGTNFFVTEGDLMTTVPFSGTPSDLFTAAGLQITPAVGPYEASTGTNLVVIRFEAVVAETVQAQEVLSPVTAEIVSYGSESTCTGQSSCSFAVSGSPDTGSLTIGMTNFSAADTVISPASGVASIQDPVQYTMTVTVPQGTQPNIVITDALASGMAVTSATMSSLPSGVTVTGSTSPSVTGNGRTVAWNLGTVTNADTNSATAEVLTFTVNAVVLNVTGNTNATAPLVNTVSIEAFGGSDVVSASSSNVTINEPKLNVTQTATPNSGTQNTSVKVTVALAHQATSNTAWNVTYTLPIPADFTLSGTCTTVVVPAPTSCAATSGVLTVVYNEVTTSQAPSFSFTLTVGPGINYGAVVPITSNTQWTTQQTNTGSASTYDTTAIDSTERTGSNTPASVNNDFVNSTTNFTETNFVITPTVLTPASLQAEVGQVVTYQVSIAVPEGSDTSATLGVSMPTGMAFVGATLQTVPPFVSCNGQAAGICTLPTPTVASGGGSATFNLGQVANSDPTAGANQSLVFQVQAVPLDIASVSASAHTTFQPTFTIGTATAQPPAVTLVEPAPTFTTTLSPATGQAGDTVTVTGTMSNPITTLGAAAYAPTLTYTMPTGKMSIITNSFSTGSCATPTTSTLTSTSALLVFPVLAESAASCSFSFQAQLSSSVQPQETELVTGQATWMSQATDTQASSYSSSSFPRTGAGGIDDYFITGGTMNASVTIVSATATLALTSGGTSPVGGIVTYLATVTVPQGTSTSLAVTAVFPPGLVFQQALASTYSASTALACGGISCNQSSAFPTASTSDGHTVSWTFANVVDSDTNDSVKKTLQWTIDAVVDNVSSAVAGATLTPTITAATDGNAGTTNSAGALTVIEPSLVLSTTLSATSGDANDVFTVTVKMQDTSSGNGAEAYNPIVSFPMSQYLQAVAGSYVAGSCPTATSNTLSTAEATFDFADLTLGTSCTFSFQVQMLIGVTPGQTIVTTGTATWTSLPGVVTQQSTYSTNSCERTGNSSDSCGTLNDYLTSVPFTLNVTDFGLAITAQTAAAAIGSSVTYLVSVTVPQGTTPNTLTLTDTLPAELTYVGTSDLSASQNLSNLECNGAACTMPTASVSGQTLTWSFGNVVNNGTNDASPEVLVFTLQTEVANVAQAVAGAQFADTISVANTSVTATSAQQTTVIEPALTFSETTVASSAPAAPQANDTVTTTVTVTNPTTATGTTAYDVLVTYTMPSGSKLTPTASTAGTCSATPTLTTNSAQFSIPSLAMGSSCTFTLTLQLLVAVAPGEVETATSLGTWSSQPGSNSGARTGNVNGPGGALNTYSRSGFNIAVTVASATSSLTLNTSAAAPVGSVVSYQASFTLPQGTTPTASFTLTLPVGLVFQETGTASATSLLTCGGTSCAFTPTVTNSGRTIVWSFANLVNAATNEATIEGLTWQALVVVEDDSAAVAGAVLAPSASVSVAGITVTPTVTPVTVIEPVPVFAASVSPTTGAAGDILTVTATVQNPVTVNGSTAQNALVSWTLPVNKLVAVAGSYSAGASCPTGTPTLSGSTAQVAFASVPNNANTCTFTIQLQLGADVSPSEVETATGEATWASITGDVTLSQSSYVSDATQRSYTQTTGLSVSAIVPASTFAFTTTPGATAAPGQQVPYHVQISVPPGTAPSMSVTVTLPPQVVFQQGANLAVSTDVTCGGGACSVAAPTVTNSGETVQFSFADVVNTATNDTLGTIAFDVDTIVLSTATAGATFTASASYVQGATTASVTSPATTVVTPQLTFTASLAPGTVAQAGDVETVTIEIQNPTSLTGATGYDTVVSYTLPSGQLSPVAGSYAPGTCPTATPTLTSNTASFSFATISELTDCTFSFQIQVGTAAVASSTVTATGQASWQSVSGSLANSLSLYSANARGALYTSSTSLSETVTVAPSSFSFAAPATLTAAIGAPVTYHATVTVPQGTTPAFTVTVSLPGQLAFASAANLTVSSGVACSGAACTLPTPVVTQNGASASFTFSDVVDSDTDDAAAETLQWDITTIVLNEASATASTSMAATAAYVQGSTTATVPASAVVIVEPALTWSASASPTFAQANEVVTVTAKVTNAMTPYASDAYNAVATWTLPSALLPVSGSYMAGTCPSGTATLSGSTASFDFSDIPVGTDCTFQFDVQVSASVTPALEKTTSLATWTSQPGPVISESTYNTEAIQRTGSTANPGGALNTYSQTGFDFSTDLNPPAVSMTPSLTQAAVGAVVTYQVAVPVQPGPTASLTMGASLPPGLVFQQAQGFTESASITCGGAACTLPTPSVTDNGHTVQWTFTSVDNSDTSGATDTLSWAIATVVENDATSTAGQTYVASASVTAGSFSTTIAATGVTVIEPALQFSTSVSPSVASAGQRVTVTVTVENPTVANGATAYNTTLTYNLPAGKLIAAPDTYQQGTCPSATPLLSDTTASFVLNPIAVPTSCTFSFQVQLTPGVSPSEVETATALATWTSQPGAVMAESPYATDASERTGNTANPGGALNTYAQTNFGFSVSTSTIISPFSFAGPSSSTAAVGGPVVYQVQVAIAPGTTPDVDATITLPTGLVFQQASGFTASSGITCGGETCALPDATVTSSGREISWTIASITDANNGTTMDSLSWSITAIVENDASSVAGTAYTASASFALGSTTAVLDAEPVTIVEPTLQLSATSTPATATAGEAITVTTTVENPQAMLGTTAYNAVVTYTLPAGQMTAVANSYGAGSCPTATPSLSGSTASFTFTSLTMPSVCSFTFQAQLTSAVNPSQTVTATGSATWASQSGSLTSQSMYATDAVPRTGNPSDVGGALNDYYASGFGFSATTPASPYTFSGPAAATASVGGLVTYHVATNISPGANTPITFNLTLPPGLVFQQGQNFAASTGITCSGVTCTLPSPTVTSNGYSVQWVVGGISDSNSGTASDSISWDVVAVVENDATSVAGATYVANATFGTGSNLTMFTAQPVTVTEPKVSFTVSASPTSVAAGSVVTVTVGVDNPTVTNGADAQSVLVAFTLPSGQQSPVAGSFLAGTCPSTGQATLTGSTPQILFPTIPQGTSCTSTFQVRMTTGGMASQMEQATAVGTWQSQPGTVTSESNYATDASARTGNTSNPGGALNDYSQSGLGYSVTVAASQLSFNGPSISTAAVGQVVTYNVAANVADQTSGGVDVTLTLPAGIVFQSGTNFTASTGVTCGAETCSLPVPTVTGNGHTVEWSLANVVDTAANASDAITWEVQTVVENDSAAVAGATQVVMASITAGANTESFTTPALTVVEPSLTFSAVREPVVAMAGKPVTVTVTLANPNPTTGSTNGTTAYDVNVSYALPPGQLTSVAGSYKAGTCPAGTPTLGASSVSVDFASVALGTSCSFSFEITPAAGSTPEVSEDAVSLATWASQPGSTTLLSTYATDSSRRTGSSTDPGGALNDYTASGFDVSVIVQPSSYILPGVGISGGGCSATGAGAWALVGLAAALRRRRSRRLA
jgi:fimbrial isopeptide formation D2 family protein